MPLENRVDPFSALVADPARGLFTGNRGILHDPETRTLLKRRWTTKAWIVCTLDHPRAVRRDVFGRNGPGGGTGWTELFFLDEVTALAAGHRPCFYCRRAAAKRFAEAFSDAAGSAAAKATEIDARLHGERLAAGAAPRPLTPAELRALPDGAMVASGVRAFALRHGALLAWSFDGYAAGALPLAALSSGALLVTPPATVAALRAGYRPVWHPSAGWNGSHPARPQLGRHPSPKVTASDLLQSRSLG